MRNPTKASIEHNAEIKFAWHQKGKEARKLFLGLPGVYEVL